MDDQKPPPRRVAPWLQWMPDWLEFGIVFIFTLAPGVYGGLLALLTSPPEKPIVEGVLIDTIIFETLSMAAVVPLMLARGWTLNELGLRFEWSDIARGAMLMIVVWVASWILWLLLLLIMPNAATAAANTELVGSKFTLLSVLILSIVNAIFEEVFVTGYLIRSLTQRRSMTAAINVSVLVRLSYHLYQGPVAVAGIVPLGLVYAYVYARTGRLWPLIVAHAIQDLIALGAYIEF